MIMSRPAKTTHKKVLKMSSRKPAISLFEEGKNAYFSFLVHCSRSLQENWGWQNAFSAARNAERILEHRLTGTTRRYIGADFGMIARRTYHWCNAAVQATQGKSHHFFILTGEDGLDATPVRKLLSDHPSASVNFLFISGAQGVSP